MNPLNRRAFLQTTATAGCGIVSSALGSAATAASVNPLDRRICGLLYGSALGDALGGPIEFQAPAAIQALPDPPRHWQPDDVLDLPARAATATRLRLRSYQPLRPQPESYGQWNVNSEAGTITDDTRHKLILLSALREAERNGQWPFEARDLARALVTWPQTAPVIAGPGYTPLAADWLEEWQLASRWILGERDPARALPPERMWQGIPTCCGQMTSLPLAAVFAGQPDRAYRAAWQLGFFDNGWGKDLNASIIAGLSVALVTPVDPQAPAAAWQTIFAALRNTDPYRYARIRWTQRSVDRWLDYALNSAREAAGHPARMFAAWDAEFRQNSKWEAQIPFVVAFGCLALAEFDPLCSLQLTQEWGWDTDSYAQLLGAFLGALYGPDLFRKEWLASVKKRLVADLAVDLDQECALLTRLEQLARRRTLVAAE